MLEADCDTDSHRRRGAGSAVDVAVCFGVHSGMLITLAQQSSWVRAPARLNPLGSQAIQGAGWTIAATMCGVFAAVVFYHLVAQSSVRVSSRIDDWRKFMLAKIIELANASRVC